MKLSIQIVNYKSRGNLKECLNSLKEYLARNGSVEIIVVNNDAEPLKGYLGEAFPGWPLEVIEVNENLGFGRAHNRGFKMAQGEYVLFLNPDTKIFPNALEGLISILEADGGVGIVGPWLVNGGGSEQEEHCGPEKTPFSTVKSKLTRDCRRLKNPSEVDWVSGGAMMLRKKIFQELGGFDEKYFMYFEDVDLCRRARKKGHKIVASPLSKIHHQGGGSFSDNREKKKYYYASQNHYLKKHFGRGSALIVRALRLPVYIKNVYFSKQ